eukprot:TRINITY_DN25365_c0_g1_i1.p1 TRINITY_DN25365_c0_g1~~TRINITY_DN25365_c0_g1_i1.p1  ORF type:complete len:107 (+),score=16.43 TRINITY_DN25365_c0_g1_i1:26-346(+)
MKQLDYKQIKEFKSMVAASTNYKVEYKYNKTAEIIFIFNAYSIQRLPPGCVIMIDPSYITTNAVKISWAMNSESAVSEYEIQFAKFRKVGYITKMKEEKCTKKQKK